VGKRDQRPFTAHLFQAAQQEASQSACFLDLAEDRSTIFFRRA